MLPHRIFKANSNLKVINIDTVACDCLPPAPATVAADEKRHCENKSGEKQEVDRFRQDNCYRNSDGENQTNVTNPVFQALNLNCDLDVGDDFENFVWIGPLGTIQFQSMVSLQKKSNGQKSKDQKFKDQKSKDQKSNQKSKKKIPKTKSPKTKSPKTKSPKIKNPKTQSQKVKRPN